MSQIYYRHPSWRRVLTLALVLILLSLMMLAPAQASETWTDTHTAQPVFEQPSTAALLEAYGQLPLSFEANQGQTDNQVKFLSRGSGYNLFLTATEAVLTLRQAAATEPRESSERVSAADVAQEGQHIEYEVLRMQLVHANPAPQVLGLAKLPGKVNYFLGQDPAGWHTDIATYAKVAYQDVYPGVDLIYYGNQGQLEYDFVVAPGADPASILLGFAGADSLAIDAQGDLVLRTAGGEIRQQRPLVYQELGGVRQEIVSRYVLKGQDQVGFAVDAYDPARPLVIDPVLVYSTYLGGSGSDQGNGIAVDSAGNAYVTGQTVSSDFPSTVGAFATTFNGGAFDAFVTKLNPAGSALVYSTYLGGSGSDQGNGIAVDSLGSAYVTGRTVSSNFPTTLGAFDTTYAGDAYADAFVTKLDPAGAALVYSTFLGGAGHEYGYGIAVDSAGSAYVTGLSEGGIPTTPGAFDTSFGGYHDAFVTKLTASGSALVYSTFLGGAGQDHALGIAVDSTFNAYVTGQAEQFLPTTLGAFDTTYGGGVQDAFVTKLNPLGSALVYSTFVGGTGNDFSYGIALDSAGSAYVTGTTTGDFPTTPGAFDTIYGGTDDAFVTKLNPAGSALGYSTYLGDGNADVGNGIAVDSTGSAYVTGGTNGAFPTTPDAFDASFNGLFEAFVTKLNPSGAALVYSTYLGGSNQDFGTGIALDSAGSAYVTGRTDSNPFPTTPGAFDTAFNGVSDAFVAKLNITPQPGSITVVKDATPTDGTNFSFVAFLNKWGSLGTGDGQFDRPEGVAVDNATGNVYVAEFGNARIQKFDSNGNFLLKWSSGFNRPSDLALDSAGNVYVTDRNNHRIQKFTSNGAFITMWGSNGTGDGQFSYPYSIVLDSSDNVYVAEEGNNRIQKFDSNGVFLAKWGSFGTGDGQFDSPAGVDVDSSGNIYVAERNNARIQQFDSNGNFLLKWGSFGTGDGQFTLPEGVDVDSSGNVYVVEHGGNARIQKFTSSGVFIAKWGSQGSAAGQFLGAAGLEVESSTGHVYVADFDNNRIQKFASFILDDAVPNDGDGISDSYVIANLLPGSQYNITEQLPAGWTQTSATCSDGSPVSAVDLSAGENVTCTFTNSGPLNAPPAISANAPTVPVDEGQTAANSGTVSDPNGDTVSLSASVGAVVNNGDGTWSWSLLTNDGPASQTVTITANDGNGGVSSTSFGLTVNNVAPTVNAGPDQSVFRNDVVTVSGSWSDPAAALDNPYTWSWDLNGDAVADDSGAANHGDTIVRNTSFVVDGVAILTFAVTDQDNATGSDTVQITVVNRTPIANNQMLSTNEDAPLPITLTANDADNDTLTYSVVMLPAHGMLSGTGPNLIYTPNADYFGLDSFTFKVTDGLADSNSATISIDVTSLNDPAVALDDSAITGEDTLVMIAVQANDSAGPTNENQTLTTSAVSDPAHGTAVINLDGSVTYTPDLDYNAPSGPPDSFTYTVCDNDGSCATATVMVLVDMINDLPVANDDSVTTPEETPVTFNVLANDSDVDGNLNPASVTVVSGPTNGTLVHNGSGSFTYTPDANFNGSDSFSYAVCDSNSVCDTADVLISVTAVNDAPVCSAATPSVAVLWPPNHQFEPVTVSGVTDEEGNAITSSITSIFQDEPTNGTGDGDTAPDGQGIGSSIAQVRAERKGNGNGRYYHISFSANDGNGGTCTGMVKVNVPKNQGKNGAAVDDGPLYNSTLP